LLRRQFDRGGGKRAWNEFKAPLATKFDVSFQEVLEDFMVLDMNFNRDKGEFRISMRKFVGKLLDQIGTSKVKCAGKTRTPGLTNVKIILHAVAMSPEQLWGSALPKNGRFKAQIA
jgi:hypothetical protein